MCLGTDEYGGPRRCPGDTHAKVAILDRQLDAADTLIATLEAELATTAGNATAPAPVSFADLKGDDRIEAMRAEIDAGVAALGSADAWSQFLAANSRFHNYSLGNVLLILAQRPDATRVASFKKWKELGRAPLKGSKAIWINAPVTRKVIEKDPRTGAEKEVRRIVGVRPVPVFDVAQTDGDPLPAAPIAVNSLTGRAPDGMTEAISEEIAAKGFTIEYADTGKAGGYTDFTNNKVVISDRSTHMQQAKTLAHELAHIELGHGERSNEYHSNPGGARPDMEVEAESTAYVLTRHFGADSGDYSFGYIDSWAKGDTERVKSTADNVVKACKSIIGRLTATDE